MDLQLVFMVQIGMRLGEKTRRIIPGILVHGSDCCDWQCEVNSGHEQYPYSSPVQVRCLSGQDKLTFGGGTYPGEWFNLLVGVVKEASVWYQLVHWLPPHRVSPPATPDHASLPQAFVPLSAAAHFHTVAVRKSALAHQQRGFWIE